MTAGIFEYRPVQSILYLEFFWHAAPIPAPIRPPTRNPAVPAAVPAVVPRPTFMLDFPSEVTDTTSMPIAAIFFDPFQTLSHFYKF